jgi:hypothetical protein
VQFGTVSFFGQAQTLVCINARKAADAEGVRMSRFRLTWIGVLFLMLFSSVAGAQSFSRYRDFEFGMDIAAVAQMIHMDASAATTVHRRPEMIQTLSWRQYSLSPSSKSDSLQTLRFDFLNGALARIVVGYDPMQVQGLTSGDIAEAISKVYGPPATPDTTVVISAPGLSEERRAVLARWEDADYSFSLFSAAYGSSFGVIAVSKRLDLMTTASDREANRLDQLEAPLREAERQKKAEEDRQAARDKARLVTKPNFRP